MDMSLHLKNVERLFDFWDEGAVKLSPELREALRRRFHKRIEKYGFLDLNDLHDLHADPNAILERAFRNFNEGNFLDAINLTLLHHWVMNHH